MYAQLDIKEIMFHSDRFQLQVLLLGIRITVGLGLGFGVPVGLYHVWGSDNCTVNLQSILYYSTISYVSF